MKKKTTKKINNNEGFATIEAVAMLFIMVTLLSFTLGTFGTIHTGIVSSIAARAYMTEILDNRADANYLRSHPVGNPDAGPHRALGFRYVGISSEDQAQTNSSNSGKPRFLSTGRNVDFRRRDEASASGSITTHNKIQTLKLEERASMGVDNVWVKIAYGICLSAACGGVQ